LSCPGFRRIAPELQIVIGIENTDCRRWLLSLARDLQEAGHDISFDVRPGERHACSETDLAIRIEARLFGRQQHPWEGLDPAALPSRPVSDVETEAPQPVRCRLELSGGPGAREAELTLVLDGDPGIRQLARRLACRHIPFVELVRPDGQIAAAGLPAVETRDVVVRGIEQFTKRLSTLILMALDRKSRPLPRRETVQAPIRSGSPLAFVASSITAKILRKISPRRLQADHWRVGLRPARSLTIGQDQLVEGFDWLPDDGARYYADPFLWAESERQFLFFEEFPYATALGIISYTELGPGGRPRFVPRPVIKRSTHLSYPYLFKHDGATYMMPENAAEGHLPLYRARRFPDDWEEMPPLVADCGLHDASLFEHDGRWWILANQACHGGASWDCLVIYHAPSPLGPFEPHSLNPVLIDVRDTRPGGPPLRMDGKLIRPVQNCLIGYGRLLQFFEIEELTPTTFRQRLRGRMLPPLDKPLEGTHTYARSGQYEAIDALFPRGITG
jgi:hypothetical protein